MNFHTTPREYLASFIARHTILMLVIAIITSHPAWADETDTASDLANAIIQECDDQLLPVGCAISVINSDAPGTALVATSWGTSCGDGDARACAYLGMLFQSGLLVIPNAQRAAFFYQKACDADIAMGCGQLGALHLHRRGVTANDTTAAGLLQRACDGGFASGCVNLGLL